MPATAKLSAKDIQQICNSMRHCRVLGITVQKIEGKQITVMLPYSDNIVGNPDSGVISGGALTTLLDTTCGMSIYAALGELVIAPTLDLRIDYMSTAKPRMPLYARAEAYRITKNIIFCRGFAFQDDENKPVAQCAATFMRLAPETIENPAAVPYFEK